MAATWGGERYPFFSNLLVRLTLCGESREKNNLWRVLHIMNARNNYNRIYRKNKKYCICSKGPKRRSSFFALAKLGCLASRLGRRDTRRFSPYLLRSGFLWIWDFVLCVCKTLRPAAVTVIDRTRIVIAVWDRNFYVEYTSSCCPSPIVDVNYRLSFALATFVPPFLFTHQSA